MLFLSLNSLCHQNAVPFAIKIPGLRLLIGDELVAMTTHYVTLTEENTKSTINIRIGSGSLLETFSNIIIDSFNFVSCTIDTADRLNFSLGEYLSAL